MTATRSERSSFETPYTTEVIAAQRIRQRAYRTTPQILRDTPGVLVQETAQGQGSPYIRGFTGYLNLFLVDGIRLNNSTFRSGPNQYWNTIDPYSIESLELVKGPTSVLYGSDAIGGTVNALTKRPAILEPGQVAAGQLYVRYATAENSIATRAETSLALDETMSLFIGVGGKSFGDLEGGSETGRQPNTGYEEWSAEIKLEDYLDANTLLSFAYQNVRQNDVPRTHQTIFAVPFEGSSIGSDLRRDLDQNRQLAYVQLHAEGLSSAIESYSLSLSWHEQEELQHRTRSSSATDQQGVDVDSLGLFAHATSPSAMGRFTYGVDYYRDSVDSFSSREPIQGPVADDASYDLLGAFVQDELDLSDQLSVTLAGRFNYAAADAGSVRDPLSGNPISIDNSWNSVVGSARFLYRLPRPGLNLFGGISQGFRAPNLSDLSRFDTARSDEFEVAAPDLEPEKYLSFELGLKSQSEHLSSQLSCFYTDIEDQISRFPTGNTTTDGDFEITKDNIGDGYVFGIEAAAALDLTPEWSLFTSASFLEGRQDTFPTSAQIRTEESIDRLMPLSAQFGVRCQAQDSRSWFEATADFADDADKLSTRDRSDTSRIPPGGTPGYLVLSLRGGWQISPKLSLNIGLENLTDEDYRSHGSGQNMPGRSLLLGLSLGL